MSYLLNSKTIPFLDWESDFLILHLIILNREAEIMAYGGDGGLVAKSCPPLVTPWTVARQAPLFMEFSRQEYWSGLPFPSPSFMVSHIPPQKKFLTSSRVPDDSSVGSKPDHLRSNPTSAAY